MTRQEWEPVSKPNSSGLFGEVVNWRHVDDFELFLEFGII